MLDDLTIALEKRTAHIVAARFELENQRHESRKKMAIEIKGLRSDALLARANIDKVRAAYARFNAAAPAHADDVDKLASDITGMQSDLEFAATVMGNSDGGSERLADTQKQGVVTPNTLAGVGDLNLPKAAPESTVAQQTATTDRVALGSAPAWPEGDAATTLAQGSASASADPRPNGADVLVRAG
jgi:hypothetical protein